MDTSTALIIGAGFAGLASAISLKEQLNTESFIIVDKQNKVGGTWAANTYPGCASDIPAPWYSLSTDLNPNWSKMQPPQPEMQQYLERVVDNHDLRSHLRLSTSVDKLDWDDENQVWHATITTADLKTFTHTAKLVYLCQGVLVYPNHFDLPGLKDVYKGEYMHSATWNSNITLKDKNVVIIGNGCSACQIVPEILDDTKQLTQIIRSPHWFINSPRSGAFALYKKLASWGDWGMRLFRIFIFMATEKRAPLFNTQNWLSEYVAKRQERDSLEFMKASIPEKYHDITMPNFRFGCKRLIYGGGYFKSLHDDKMLLTKEDITYLTEDEIHTKQGNSYKCDVLIAATGYDTKKSMLATTIYGQDKSMSLGEKWNKDGITAYNTILVDGYPNLFMLAGPNSVTGHSSVVLAIENAMVFIRKIAKPVVDDEKESVVVKQSAYENWKETITNALSKTVFSTPYGGCVSWYGNSGNFVTYPWTQITYWWKTNFPIYSDLLYTTADKKSN